MQRMKIVVFCIATFCSSLSFASNDHYGDDWKSDSTQSEEWSFSILGSVFYRVFSGNTIELYSQDGLNRFRANPFALEFLSMGREIFSALKFSEHRTEENILIVIDMQATFKASESLILQEAILNEIKASRRNGEIIIFLEYDGDGPTIPSIVKAVEDYPRLYIGSKKTDSGGDIVCSLLQELGIVVKNVRVCGVRTEACVFSTVHTLSQSPLIHKITLVGNACNSGDGHSKGQSYMNQMWLQIIEKKIFNAKVDWMTRL